MNDSKTEGNFGKAREVDSTHKMSKDFKISCKNYW